MDGEEMKIGNNITSQNLMLEKTNLMLFPMRRRHNHKFSLKAALKSSS
jgi:hypothetical protein